MTNKRIAINNEDGTVSIIVPAPEMFDSESRTRMLTPELDGKTDEEVLQWIIDKDVPLNKSYKIIDIEDLPADREFRNAWTFPKEEETKVDIDVDKAVEIRKDKLREIRKPLLEALDVEFMQALEKGQNTAEIVAKKQELRDVTSVEFPATIDELKEFVPEILKESK